MSPAFPRALREGFSGYLRALALSVTPKKIWKSFLTHTDSGVAGISVGHRRWARKRTPAVSPQTEQRPPGTPPLAVPAFPNTRRFGQRAMHPALPPRRGRSLRRKQGGAGGIISDLADRKSAHNPVYTRHALRAAWLARRALRLTAGVNPACLCPSAGLLTSPGAPVR